MAPTWRAILLCCVGLSLASAASSPPEPSPCATVSGRLAPFTAAPTPSVTEAPLVNRQDGLPGGTTTSILVPATATCWSTGTTFACSMGSSLSETCCVNGCTFSPTSAIDIESGGHDGLPPTVTSTASFDGIVSIANGAVDSATANWTLTLDQKLEKDIADIINGYCSDNGLFSPDRRDVSGLTLPGFVGCDIGDLKPSVEPTLSNEIALALYDKVQIPVLAVNAYAQRGMLPWNFRRTVVSICAMAILSGLYSVRLIQESYEIPIPLVDDAVAKTMTMPSVTGEFGVTGLPPTSNPCPACTGAACPTLNPKNDQGEDGPLPVFFGGVQVPFMPNLPVATTAPPRTGRICTQYANPSIYECAGCSCTSGTHSGLYSFSEFAYATKGTDGVMTTSTDICYGHSTYPATSLSSQCDPTVTPTISVTWAPDYCTHITSKKGDQRGDEGYCECPGQMPYYPSTRYTTQTTSGMTISTYRPCGYTALPPIESLINTTATTGPGPTYVGGHLPSPVTVSSPYCSPTDSSVPGFAKKPLDVFIVDYTCKVWMNYLKPTWYPGVSDNFTGVAFSPPSWPGKHSMAMVVQYYEDTCESTDNKNVTLGTDISVDKCKDIMNSIVKDCGYIRGGLWEKFYVGGGYYADCVYFSIVVADDIDTRGWPYPFPGLVEHNRTFPLKNDGGADD